ncbi:MAG: glycosyltransferase family 4 protein [Planctomycetota bacterium]|nr:glycosyltransferase family 4 protein [Planctomycetota bacterium]
MPGKPRVCIVNQYYVPDVASTGILLHELARELAQTGHEVEVITARPSYGPPESWVACPARETFEGVRVTRLRVTRFSKDRTLGRLVNFLSFLIPLFFRMLLGARRDTVYLYSTNPPFLGIVGGLISLVRRHRYVNLLHDAYPDLAVWVGKIRAGSAIERVWLRLNRLTYSRGRRAIVLCEAAKELVESKWRPPSGTVRVIHNWTDPAKITPRPKAESALAREHGLVDPFVALYSGNLGLYYDFDTLLGAAELLKGENFRLVLIGGGGKRDQIARAIKERGLTNTLLLPYVPTDRLGDSLIACDTSVVSIAPGIEGISFPSKLYTSLATGRPILAISEERSELRRMVEREDCGRWFRVGDASALAEGLRAMMRDRAGCARQGENSRRFFDREFTLEAAAAKYAQVFEEASR